MTDQIPGKAPARPRPVRRIQGETSFLHPGEQVTLRAEISNGIYWKCVAVFCLSVVFLFFAFNLGIFLLLVTFIMFVVANLTQHYLLLLLTDQRLLIRFGVMNLEVIQMHYNRIESVEVFWTPMGRMLGYGSVVITGTGSRRTVIPFIGNAALFRSTLDNLIYNEDEKPKKVEITNPGTATG